MGILELGNIFETGKSHNSSFLTKRLFCTIPLGLLDALAEVLIDGLSLVQQKNELSWFQYHQASLF